VRDKPSAPLSNEDAPEDAPPSQNDISDTTAPETDEASESETKETVHPRLYTPSTIPSPYTSAPPAMRTLSRPPPSSGSLPPSTISAAASRTFLPPLQPTMTGTRYGVALGGPAPLRSTPTGTGTLGRSWGGGTPQCPKCGKAVYFAEQVKAVGQTFHKHCLRCVQCNTLLAAGRLAEKDGEPFCHRCYAKVHGPAGAGYALLGKAGG
jgi:hypothetical protein